MKKFIMALIVGIGLTFTAAAGYASVSYILNKTIDQSVTVGDTVLYTDGLLVELTSYDNYTLTYFELEETDTQKHYVTYIYDYTVLVGGMNVEVSSVGDDIIVTDFSATETQITITFSLNQEKDFNNGDIVNIQFYFEAVEISVGGFTVSNPININTASESDLIAIGFTASEASEIEPLGYVVSDLDELYNYIYISDYQERFSEYVTMGIIVFE